MSWSICHRETEFLAAGVILKVKISMCSCDWPAAAGTIFILGARRREKRKLPDSVVIERQPSAWYILFLQNKQHTHFYLCINVKAFLQFVCAHIKIPMSSALQPGLCLSVCVCARIGSGDQCWVHSIQRTITILYIMGLASSICILCASFQRTISGHRINHRNGTAITRALNVPKEIVISWDCVLYIFPRRRKTTTTTTTKHIYLALSVFICVPFASWVDGLSEHCNSDGFLIFAIGFLRNVWIFATNSVSFYLYNNNNWANAKRK